MKLWGILLACALVLSCARPQPDRVTPPQPAPPPSKTAESTREIRAVWVSNTDRLDWDGATRNLQRAGFNTMYVNFASGGAAFYPSQLVPEVPGSPDPSAGIALAHQRGIQVHGKLIVTFMFRTTPEFQRRLLAANRAMRGPDGKPIEQAGYYWLCPTQDSNRTLLGGIVNEMVTRYPVDGLQFDYIRFCEQPSCYCSHCKREFEKATGRAVTDTLPFKSWQQQQITSLVRELSTRAHAARPGLVVSSAVFPDLNRAKEEKAQDWQIGRAHV